MYIPQNWLAPGTADDESNWRERGWNSSSGWEAQESRQASGHNTETRERPDPWDPTQQSTRTVVGPSRYRDFREARPQEAGGGDGAMSEAPNDNAGSRDQPSDFRSRRE